MQIKQWVNTDILKKYVELEFMSEYPQERKQTFSLHICMSATLILQGARITIMQDPIFNSDTNKTINPSETRLLIHALTAWFWWALFLRHPAYP
jgi:hypothetical protein